MGNLWLKIKVWTKVTLFGLLILYALVFIVENSGVVEVWVWPNHTPKTSILLLVLYAFATGIVLTILVRTTLKTLRQIRDLKSRSRTDRLERDMADMKMKAAMLREKTAASLPDSAPAAPLADEPSGPK
jgi:uncharacterized integral membrane protein